MSTQELLTNLLKLDIKLWVDGERLRYNAPQGVMTAELQAELVRHKTEIIARLKSLGSQDAPVTAPVERPAHLPLSFGQQRLWLADQLEPGNAVYNVFNAVRLCGPLDVAALEQAYQQMVQRHESLRTSFKTVDEQPEQVIAAWLEVALRVVDLSALGQTQREVEAQRLALEEARRPFDLVNGPLVRCSLLRLDEGEHILLLSMHHIISDGWSLGVFFREIILLSQGLPLAELPLQYADFALWQRNWLQGETLERQQAYWQKQLDKLSALELPSDHERPAQVSARGASYARMLSRELMGKLKSFSQQTGISLFMVLLAGFTVVLSRYSGQMDVAVRTPIANRIRKELEGLIGYFVNTLVLRTDLSGAASFRGLLASVGEMCQEAYDHQDMPLEKILENIRLGQRADGRRGSLFPVMFILQNAPLLLPEVGGMQFENLELDNGLAPFELTMELRELKDGISCALNYSTDLFEPASMERLVGHFEQVLERAMANPEQDLGSLLDGIPAEELPAFRMETKRAPSSEYVAPRSELEQIISRVWAETLQVEKVGIHDNFFELGGDSLLVMRVVARSHRAGLHFTPQDFFQYQTIAELAVQGAAAAAYIEPETVIGLLPLTVAQRDFFSEKAQYPDYWNIPRLIEVPAGINPDVVEQIVQYLWTYHDALRTRFIQTEAGWQQLIPAPDENTPVPFSYLDFSGLPAREHTEAIERAASELQQSLSISEGPLMRVTLFNLGADRPGRLFVVMHHLIYDATSGIFFEDFFTIFQQVSRGEPAQLPPKTASIRQWLERLDVYTRSPELHQELDYWLSLPWTQIHPLPVDYPENRGQNTWGSAHSVPVRLSPQETEVLLREIPKAYGVQVVDILMAAMVQTLTMWSTHHWLMLNTVDFGRNAIPNVGDLDMSRTLGWFSMAGRLILQRSDHVQLAEVLKSIKVQLQHIPNRGVGYELLLYAYENKPIIKKLQELPKPEILFNYLGRQTTNVKLKEAYEYPGPVRDPGEQRQYLVDCSLSILDGRLITNWRYSKNLYKNTTIKKMAESYMQWLQTLVAQYASGK